MKDAHETEIKNLKGMHLEEIQALKMSKEVEVKKRDQIITEQDFKIKEVNEMLRSEKEYSQKLDVKIADVQQELIRTNTELQTVKQQLQDHQSQQKSNIQTIESEANLREKELTSLRKEVSEL